MKLVLKEISYILDMVKSQKLQVEWMKYVKRNKQNTQWRLKELGLKSSTVKAKKLELKSTMKANEGCQSGSNTMWEKMVKDSYSSSCYDLNLYLIFTNKFKGKEN